MNTEDRLERLAARARAESPVLGASVAPEVLRRVRAGVPAAAPDRPLWWVAAAAMAVALIMVALDYPVLLGLDNPGEWASAAGWMML